MMDNMTAAKKETGLGDFLKRYEPQQLEDRHNITPQDSHLQEIVEKYQSALAQFKIWIDHRDLCEIFADVILPPPDIQLFLAATVRCENHPEYGIFTGKFISALLQNSYDAGHNDFSLDTSLLGKTLACVGSYINFHSYIRRENLLLPFSLKIKGDVGNNSGARVDNVHYTLDGKMKDYCFSHAFNSIFTLGEIPVGVYAVGLESKDCIFKTTSRATVRKLRKRLEPQNKIVFIHPDGEEETVRESKDD